MAASDREMPGPDPRPTVDGSPLDPTAHLARSFRSFPGCRGLRVVERAQSSQTLQEFELVLRWVLPRSEAFCICGHPGTRDILVRTTSCLRYTRLGCPLFAAAPRSDAAFLWQRYFGAMSCEKGTGRPVSSRGLPPPRRPTLCRLHGRFRPDLSWAPRTP